MNEKIFKSMGFAGVCAMVIGILVMTVGVVSGIMNIVSGSMLLRNRKDVIF